MPSSLNSLIATLIVFKVGECGTSKGPPGHKRAFPTSQRVLVQFPSCSSTVDQGVHEGEVADSLKATAMAIAGLGLRRNEKQAKRTVVQTQ